MTPDTQKRVLEYVKLSAALLSAHAQLAATREEQHTKIAALIPKVVDALVKHKRIEADEVKQASELLLDHTAALEILKNTAGHRSAEELARLGGPAENKSAAANGNGNGHMPMYLGQKTSAERPSDRKFLERLGVIN